MGWWRAGEDGSSLHVEDTGLIWGDAPADVMDVAVESIIDLFLKEQGRRPTKAEMFAGLKFAVGIYDDDMVAG